MALVWLDRTAAARSIGILEMVEGLIVVLELCAAVVGPSGREVASAEVQARGHETQREDERREDAP
ncbi:MAG: hypothetical protein AAGD10_09860 [Myxococcota bacterium]